MNFTDLAAGAPNEGVPQNICSAVEIQLAGKMINFHTLPLESFKYFQHFNPCSGWMRTETGGDSKRTISREPYHWFNLSQVEK